MSPNDNNNITIYEYAKGSRPGEVPGKAERRKIVNEKPVAAALNFERIIHVLQRYVFGWDPRKKRPLRYVLDNDDQKNKREIGGLLGVVKGYAMAVEDQGRGSLHVHGLIWLAGYDDLIRKIMTELQVNRQAATRHFTTQFQNVLQEVISNEVHLPMELQSLTVKCTDGNCGGMLHCESEEKVEQLRVKGSNEYADPFVIVCETCHKRYGPITLLTMAVSKLMEKAGFGPIPEDKKQRDLYKDDVMWKIRKDPPQPNTAKYDAALAFVQLNSNTHSPVHTHTCFKKNKGAANVCRFHIPFHESDLTEISLDIDKKNNNQVKGILIKEKRSCANIFTVPTNPDFARIFGCNTNMKFVHNHLLGYYLGLDCTQYICMQPEPVEQVSLFALQELT